MIKAKFSNSRAYKRRLAKEAAAAASSARAKKGSKKSAKKGKSALTPAEIDDSDKAEDKQSNNDIEVVYEGQVEEIPGRAHKEQGDSDEIETQPPSAIECKQQQFTKNDNDANNNNNNNNMNIIDTTTNNKNNKNNNSSNSNKNNNKKKNKAVLKTPPPSSTNYENFPLRYVTLIILPKSFTRFLLKLLLNRTLRYVTY